MMVLRVGIQLKPPLLQMYILPSGPRAAPLGPPGISATTSLRPAGQTPGNRRPRVSTSTNDPTGIATGPSGNSTPVASTRIFDINSSRFLLVAGRPDPGLFPATFCLHSVMAKTLQLAHKRAA